MLILRSINHLTKRFLKSFSVAHFPHFMAWCVWRRGALHRRPVMCFSLETVWEILGNKACASQGALTVIIFSQKKKEHSSCLPDRSVLWKDMKA